MNSIIMKCVRPKNELKSVYSNFDHSLEQNVVEELKNEHSFSQHSAWNFCGYIWYEGGKWHEDIWIYHRKREHLEGESIMDVIREANDRHGHD